MKSPLPSNSDHLSLTNTILRSQIGLLLHRWHLNNDRLSATATILGSPRVVIVHRFDCNILFYNYVTHIISERSPVKQWFSGWPQQQEPPNLSAKMDDKQSTLSRSVNFNTVIIIYTNKSYLLLKSGTKYGI